MIDLYKNIKKRRQELKISQSKLAELVGYTNRSSIAKIEAGKIDLPQSKNDPADFRAVAHYVPGADRQFLRQFPNRLD